MHTFSFRLDLVLLLIDSTTGKVVEEMNVIFKKNGKILRPDNRGVGTYILINTGREDFDLHAQVEGYLDYETRVEYEKLSEREPTCTLYLIPDENLVRGAPVLTLRGRIPKLEEIELISLFKPRSAINEYNAKKQEITVFQVGGSRYLEDVHYGILHAQEETYEHIEIEKNISDSRMKLRYPLAEAFSVNDAICRVVFGSVDAKGNFLIAMRDTASNIPVIIRYKKAGETYFLKGNFHDIDEKALKKAKKQLTETDEEEKPATKAVKAGKE